MNFRLDLLLTSNIPPDVLQARHVREELTSALTELSGLEEALERLTIITTWVKKRRDRTDELVSGFRGILSPLRTLPPEILAAIFLICSEDARASDEYSMCDVRQAPMALTHVSSRWRSVCLTTRSLWENIDICLTKFTTIPPLPYIHTLLARSGARPLHVTFVANPFEPTWEEIRSLQKVLALLSQQERLEEIQINLGSFDLPLNAWRQSHPFPRLTAVRIETESTAIENLGIRDVGLFSTAPLLRSVKLSTPDAPASLWASGFQWSQLTVLSLHIELGLIEGRDILIQCVRLTDCSMSFAPDEGDDEISLSANPTSFPELHSLHLEFSTENDGFEAPLLVFFAQLEFPRMTSLTIDAQTWPTGLLQDLHHCAPFELEELVLLGPDFADVEIISFFRLLQTSLRTIYLDCYGFDDGLFAAFTWPSMPTGSESSLVLPHLHSLHLLDREYDGDNVQVSGSAVANLAESVSLHADGSNAAFPLLRSLALHICSDEFDPDIRQRLEEATDTGVVTYSRIEPDD
ncbi:hypothetical protein C8R46DRAFT_1078213 [Mycena filopes]|nr:hypothetical protein C8R46DRAFT_1078213 [Mycena filopes]